MKQILKAPNFKVTLPKTCEVKRMLEIRNQKLLIDGTVIGNETYLLNLFEKAIKYDELKAETNFKEGDA